MNGKRILAGVDQGPTISLDGGLTWDLNWYNLPNGQFYHISTDTRFPYWIYGTQQDSGCGRDRQPWRVRRNHLHGMAALGRRLRIRVSCTPIRWTQTSSWPAGKAPPSSAMTLTTRQILRIFRLRAAPASASPVSATSFRSGGSPCFLFGAQYLLETRDLGNTWKAVSPDVTLAPGETPPPAEPAEPAAGGRGGRGVTGITAIGPSPLRAGAVWVGTSNGRMQRTADGTTWQNATPADLARQQPDPTNPGLAA
jgi:hypothetical protein